MTFYGSLPDPLRLPAGDLRPANIVDSIRGGLFIYSMGDSVASANNLAPPSNGLIFHVTGATQINLISNLGALGGSPLTMIFDSTPVVKNNQAASGDYKPIILNAGVDFATAVNSTLSVVYDTKNNVFIETGRKA